MKYGQANFWCSSKGLCSAVGLLSFFWFPLMANLGSIPAGDMFFISEINEWNVYFIRNLTVCYKDLWVSSPSLLFDSGVGAYHYEEKGQISWVSLPITMHFYTQNHKTGGYAGRWTNCIADAYLSSLCWAYKHRALNVTMNRNDEQE